MWNIDFLDCIVYFYIFANLIMFNQWAIQNYMCLFICVCFYVFVFIKYSMFVCDISSC